MIHMKSVESSMISHIGYDQETRTLRIRFHKGSNDYEYPDVPVEEYEVLRGAPSIGSHFHSSIKKVYGENVRKVPQG